MFDVGFWEIAIIALIALLVLGPERLPRTARTVGLWVGKARRTLAEVKRDIDREIDASELKELNTIKEDLKDTKKVFEEAASTINEKVGEEYETVAVKPDIKKPEPSVTDEATAAPETKTAT